MYSAAICINKLDLLFFLIIYYFLFFRYPVVGAAETSAVCMLMILYWRLLMEININVRPVISHREINARFSMKDAEINANYHRQRGCACLLNHKSLDGGDVQTDSATQMRFCFFLIDRWIHENQAHMLCSWEWGCMEHPDWLRMRIQCCHKGLE